MSSRNEQKREPDLISTEGEISASRRVIKGIKDPLNDIEGTVNQVIVTVSGEKIIISLPQNIDINADVVFDTLAIDKILFNLTAGLSVGEGEMSWNDDDGSLNLGMPGGEVVQQIGLEGLIRVSNKSGAEIVNGKFVYVTGSQGNRLTIGLADNTDADKLHILGMVTENIPNNQSGYVTIWGDVRGSTEEPINTSGLVEGDKLYLDANGNWTDTHPTNPLYGVEIVGTVRKVHATEGIIYVTRPEVFTLGNNFNGTMRQSVINKSTGNAAAAGFTAVNNQGYFTTIGIAGSGNVTFPNNVSIHYAPGYGDHWQSVDGNKDFVWFTDPTDSHNNSSLTNEIMRLLSDGTLLFVDTGGFSGGSMYNHDVPTTVIIPGVNTPTRIPSGFTQGRAKNVTFQNAREFVISKAGYYDIDWSISFDAASANQEIEGFVMVNNIMNVEASAHRRISTATDTGAMSGVCSILLAVNDVLSLGVMNETSGSNIIIEHSNMKFIQVSG